jgi:DeoR/GlpR family transcriptional regulator of sugar metabolism
MKLRDRKKLGPDDKESARQRRAFIRSQLLNEGLEKLSFADIRQQPFGNVSDETLYKDAHFLQQDNQPIIVSKKHFLRSASGISTVRRRALEGRSEKEAIGRMAERLIAPPFAALPTLKGIASDLQTRLAEYWKKAHRLVILDAGSTTAAIARHLGRLRTPDPLRNLADLRIFTNGNLIHQELNKSGGNHGVILLGGAERHDTEAVAGTLAEECLRAFALKADIAIIGTTNLNEDGNFCSDSEDEARIKSRLLESARIRCIAADSQKLVNPGRGSTWVFAAFSRYVSGIDIIITDADIHKHQGHEERERLRLQFLERARKNQILVAHE